MRVYEINVMIEAGSDSRALLLSKVIKSMVEDKVKSLSWYESIPGEFLVRDVKTDEYINPEFKD